MAIRSQVEHERPPAHANPGARYSLAELVVLERFAGTADVVYGRSGGVCTAPSTIWR